MMHETIFTCLGRSLDSQQSLFNVVIMIVIVTGSDDRNKSISIAYGKPIQRNGTHAVAVAAFDS